MKKLKKAASLLLVVSLVAMSGLLAYADTLMPEEPSEPEAAAKIGETEYSTIDAAIEAAEDGDTIALLKNVKADKTFYKSLTFTGGYTLSMDVYGWRYNGNLVFDGADFEISSDAESPAANNGEAARWFTMVVGGSITAQNNAHITFTFDSASGTKCAIYANKGVKINVENSSSFHIIGKNTKGVDGQGIQLDSTAGTGIFVKNKSDFLIDGTNRGYVNSPEIYVEGSDFTVQNCTNNGSNGGKFTAINSKIYFLNNTGHGLSAGNVVIRDSLVSCNGNGYTGFHVAGTMDASTTETGTYKTKIEAIGNSWNTWDDDLFAGLRLTGNANIGNGVTVNVSDNYGVGIRANSVDAVYNFDEGVSLTVMTNGKATAQGTQYNTKGGGIWNKGTMSLPSTAAIYNNHATVAGDDIYNAETASITFSSVGSDWTLDGEPDHCTDAITGWFDDAEGNRWNAHGNKPYHVDEFTGYGTAVTGLTALKAAHGLLPTDGSSDDWQISKSKEATNLDSNYISDVTLSLPSAQENLAIDVVFVLDESSCSGPVKEKVAAMLEELYAKVEETNATVKIGAVQFRGEVTKLELTELSEDTKNEITQFMSSRPETGGSNMSAGILAGKKMLNSDTSVDAGRKYLIVVSDGITYIWDDETTEAQENYGVNYANTDTPDNPMLAGPDAWDVSNVEKKYVPENWESYLKNIGDLLTTTISEKASLYDRANPTEGKPFVSPREMDQYASTVDIALYKSLQAYQSAEAEGYKTYVVVAGEEKDMETFPFGPSFMEYLAKGESYTFDNILNEIVYLVDAGSYVIDKIGKTADYNFDLWNPESMVLKVGDKVYTAEASETETNVYYFGEADGNGIYPYVVRYYPENENNPEEYFKWEINVPVSNLERVSLTYSVKLMNPKTAEGTYGEYDRYGDNNKTSLYTNNEAIIYPVDSNGQAGMPEKFKKPTVSYTVGGSTPIYPSTTSITVQKIWTLDNGGSAADYVTVQLMQDGKAYGDPVVLSAENQWRYTWDQLKISGTYTAIELNAPDGFTATVTKNGSLITIVNDDIETPEEPAEPTTPEEPEQPSKPDTPDQPDEPETDVPKTGDDQNVAFWMLLMAATLAALGMTLKLGRKER